MAELRSYMIIRNVYTEILTEWFHDCNLPELNKYERQYKILDMSIQALAKHYEFENNQLKASLQPEIEKYRRLD